VSTNINLLKEYDALMSLFPEETYPSLNRSANQLYDLFKERLEQVGMHSVDSCKKNGCDRCSEWIVDSYKDLPENRQQLFHLITMLVAIIMERVATYYRDLFYTTLPPQGNC